MRQNWEKMRVVNQITMSCLTLLLLFPAFYVGVQALVDSSAEQRLLNELSAVGAENRSIAFFGRPSLPSKLRVISGGKIDGTQIYAAPGSYDFTTSPALEYEIFVLNDEHFGHVDLAGFELERIPTNNFKDVDAPDAFKSLFNGQLDEYLESRRAHLNLLVRSHDGSDVAH